MGSGRVPSEDQNLAANGKGRSPTEKRTACMSGSVDLMAGHRQARYQRLPRVQIRFFFRPRS